MSHLHKKENRQLKIFKEFKLHIHLLYPVYPVETNNCTVQKELCKNHTDQPVVSKQEYIKK